jgi:sensor histidine kinase YesM
MIRNSKPIIFYYRIVWHIIFWIIIYFTYVISYGGYGNNNFHDEFIINGMLLPVRIVFTYIMLYLLLPLVIQRQYAWFILLTVVHTFIFGFLIWITYRQFIIMNSDISVYEYKVFYFSKIFVSIISNSGILLLACMLKLFKWWYIDQLYKLQIEKEKTESELNYLKAQINPHFLFNTLNNLYALTLQNSNKASDIVIKLSGLLDYMLYYAKADKVPLDKELTIIENYIELEKIRYGERLNMVYEVVGDRNSIQIAPLILIPLIENAFKHGASNDRAKPSIKVLVRIGNALLNVTVENTVPDYKIINKDVSNGIGLNNLKRLLDLIYKDGYILNVDSGDKYYKVNLEIKCN